MDIDLADLPDNVETLQRMVRTLRTERATLTEAQAEIERLRLIVQKLQRSQFGRRAERLDDDQLQFGLKTSTPISRGSKPRFHQGRSRRPDRGPIDQACRRICPATTCGSISSIKRSLL